MEDRLITVAIHTYEKALVLKSLLESEGIGVTLQNVNLVQPVVSSGVRVRIHEADLPLALRVIETSDISGTQPAPADTAAHHLILVPVDESSHSLKAVKIAFRLAAMQKARVMLLHAFMAPVIGMVNPIDDTLDFSGSIADSEDMRNAEAIARKLIDKFGALVSDMIKRGDIPPVQFTTRLEEGVPEEVINAVAREVKPMMLVMGTRGATQKERDMIGSVTAEVLDTCRFTVLTVPDDATAPTPGSTLSTIYFGNMDQADMLALDSLYRIFNKISLNVTVVPVAGKKNALPDQASMDRLLGYCSTHYPRFTFTKATVGMPTITSDVSALLGKGRTELLVMPNKKRNVFARFFNPTLPHRLLYDAGLPMLVIPV